MAGAKYGIQYYVTLYNRDLGTHGGFYGRTFHSPIRPLKESAGSWDYNMEECVYFHSSYLEKTSFIIIECVIVRDVAGSKSLSSGGYAVCDAFAF